MTLPRFPQPQDLRIRLKEYSLRILRLYDSLPHHGSAQVVGRQLARSGTSPGAQYREGCRAKSNADFISKLEGALQELEESRYWLEILAEGNYIAPNKLHGLRTETDELIAILVTIVRKVKAKKNAR